ncbi:MAG: hypothetical protein EOO88_36240 [Pedobacter sp.]|nr:MAG: hypothetical protein EOO88_36240 [Pedobacter sp.]
MAINQSNTVYQKRAGTGAAYVLPENQALGLYLNTMASDQKRQELLDAAKLKRQQEIQDANTKTIGSLSIGDHWSARENELQKDYNAVADYALNATHAGQKIDNDRDFLNKRSRIIGKAAASRELQKVFEQTTKDIGANPDGYKNPIAVLKSIRDANLDDYMDGKWNPPTLQRVYSLSDAIKDSNGTISYLKNNDGAYDTTKVNRSGNVGQALASLSTPAAKYLVNESGGDTGTYIGGFPTVTPDGKTYFNTQGKPFEDAVINQLATDPNFGSFLQSKGYDVSNTDAIRKSAFDFAKKQNEAAGSYVKNYADLLENKATTDTTRIFAAEANARQRRDQQMAEGRYAHDQRIWADEALASSPDAIVANVKTNIASTKTGGGGIVNRPSTSFAAANVGNSRSSFLPMTTFDPETGLSKARNSTVNITSGQIHIKPVLRFGGVEKILDDESLSKIKEGKYKINGKVVPANASISYDELLYGEQRIPADPNDIMSKATVEKLIVPVTGQPLNKKFDKEYNRVNMWNTAIKSMTDEGDRKRAALQVVKQYNEGKGYSDAELKAQAAKYLNTIK